MKKKYIIKKARKLLVEQINSHQTIVRNDMNNIETMSNMKGLSEVIPKDNDGYCTISRLDKRNHLRKDSITAWLYRTMTGLEYLCGALNLRDK